jgi:hypothetical protein
MNKKILGLTIVMAVSAVSAHAASTAIRSLSASTYSPGQPITVTVTVTPDPAILAYGLEENFPDSWLVSGISDGGGADRGLIKWGVYRDHQVRALTYTITPPSGETGAKSFSGVTSFDGVSQNIAGTTSIDSASGGTTDPNSGSTAQIATDTQFLAFKNAFNPGHETLTIKYTVPGQLTGSSAKSSAVYGSTGGSSGASLIVYDRQGAKVRELTMSNGQSRWDGKNSQGTEVVSGTYLLVLKQGSKVVKKKVVVVK